MSRNPSLHSRLFPNRHRERPRHRRARPFVVARPWQRVVSPFPGDAVGAGQQFAVHHNAAANAGAQDDAKHHAMAGTGAIGRLRQREAVGIVLDVNVAIESLHQVTQQRPPVQPGRIAVAH